MDEERSSMLPMMAAGKRFLISILSWYFYHYCVIYGVF